MRLVFYYLYLFAFFKLVSFYSNCILHSRFSFPRSLSGYVLLHHIIGSTFGEDGRWGHAIGGMGAITEAMRRACAEAGVEVVLNTAVTEVCCMMRKFGLGLFIFSFSFSFLRDDIDIYLGD
jgi:phytoene dehydrogenase-like protein